VLIQEELRINEVPELGSWMMLDGHAQATLSFNATRKKPLLGLGER
jgi:hypothetical protein